MPALSIAPERISSLDSRRTDPSGHAVIYWMRASQRADQNPALETAVAEAAAMKRPVVVVFALT